MIKKHNLLLDFILVIISFGIWNIWMQYRQIQDINTLEKSNEYSFLSWLILSIITFGLYHVYHEYKLTRSLYVQADAGGDPELVALLAGLLSLSGLWIFVDLYQQELLNRSGL